MKKILLLLTVFTVVVNYTYSQTFEWATSIGSPVQDEGRAITTDSQGNVYTTGIFRYSADFDPDINETYELTTVTSQDDIFVQKLNAAGEFQWAFQIGGVNWDGPRAITTDQNGDIYLVGHFISSADFDPNPEVDYILSSNGTEDIFIAKYTTEGELVWAKQMGGIAPDIAFALSTDNNGNVYLGGTFEQTVDFDPGPETFDVTSESGGSLFITKFDTDGELVWAKSLSSTNHENVLSMMNDSEGNIYFTGLFYGSMDFDPEDGIDIYTSFGSYSDIFICKWTTDGELVWVKTYGENGFDVGSDLVLDGLGHLYATGRFEGTVDFDSGAGTQNVTAIGGADIYLLKLSTNGDIFWVRSFGSAFAEWGQGVDVDSAGDVYITGFYLDTVDFDPSGETANLTSAGGEDIFVCKYDDLGELVWASSMGGPNSQFGDRGQDIHLDINNNIYTTGWFYDVADFDPSNDAFSIASQGSFDIFTHKMNQPTIDIEETEKNEFAVVYPNPTDDGSFRIASTYNTSIESIVITDASGRMLEIITQANCNRTDIKLKGNSGVYFAEVLFSDGKNQHLKIIKR